MPDARDLQLLLAASRLERKSCVQATSREEVFYSFHAEDDHSHGPVLAFWLFEYGLGSLSAGCLSLQPRDHGCQLPVAACLTCPRCTRPVSRSCFVCIQGSLCSCRMVLPTLLPLLRDLGHCSCALQTLEPGICGIQGKIWRAEQPLEAAVLSVQGKLLPVGACSTSHCCQS